MRRYEDYKSDKEKLDPNKEELDKVNMKNLFNPWHDVDPLEPNTENVIGVIEISRGSRAKYEVDKKSGMIKLDRVLYSSVYYPANYGFIPKTLCGDHDPLDILVISQVDIVPLCLVSAKIIGVMRMIDNNEEDDKLISVAAGDPSYNHISDISELPNHLLLEIKNFFESYKKLENKSVVIKEFLNKEKALEILSDSFKMYDDSL